MLEKKEIETVTLFVIDEYGRTLIEDKELLEIVNGADVLFSKNYEGCNSACGSNGVCANISCI